MIWFSVFSSLLGGTLYILPLMNYRSEKFSLFLFFFSLFAFFFSFIVFCGFFLDIFFLFWPLAMIFLLFKLKLIFDSFVDSAIAPVVAVSFSSYYPSWMHELPIFRTGTQTVLHTQQTFFKSHICYLFIGCWDIFSWPNGFVSLGLHYVCKFGQPKGCRSIKQLTINKMISRNH